MSVGWKPVNPVFANVTYKPPGPFAGAGAYGNYGENWCFWQGCKHLCDTDVFQGISSTKLYERCCGFWANDVGFCSYIYDLVINRGYSATDLAQKYADYLYLSGGTRPDRDVFDNFAFGDKGSGVGQNCPPGTTGTFPNCDTANAECPPGDFFCQIGQTIGDVGRFAVIGGAIFLAVKYGPDLLKAGKKYKKRWKEARED